MELVTLESALNALEHLEQSNSSGRKAEAREMLEAAATPSPVPADTAELPPDLAYLLEYIPHPRVRAEAKRKIIDAIASRPAPVAEQKPVAMVDAGDDGMFAEILPDVSVKVGQMLYAAPVADKDAMTRLRRVLGLLDITDPFPTDDDKLHAVLFSLLGQIAREIEKRPAPVAEQEPVAWRIRPYDHVEQQHSDVWTLTRDPDVAAIYRSKKAIIEPLVVAAAPSQPDQSAQEGSLGLSPELVRHMQEHIKKGGAA